MKLTLGKGQVLKLFGRSHVIELHELIQGNLEHLSPWKTWIEGLQTKAQIQYFIDANERAFNELMGPDFNKRQHAGFQLGIFVNDQIVGLAGYQGLNLANRIASLGYWIAQGHEGKGLVTKSCSKMIDYGIEVLRINRFEIQCTVDNVRSMAVAERLGFKKEAVLEEVEFIDGVFMDHAFYRLLAREWAKKS